jgi:endoglucanase
MFSPKRFRFSSVYSRLLKRSVLLLGMLAFVLVSNCSAGSSPLAESNYDLENASPQILVDQFGYRLDDPKFAVISQPYSVAKRSEESSLLSLAGSYQVVDVQTMAVVFQAEAQAWNGGAIHDQSGDRALWFDFSAFKTPGRYIIKSAQVDQLSSPQFTIAGDVYRDLLVAATRMFFYQRSGFEKQPPFADPRWTDSAAFLGPRQDTEARFVDDKDNVDLARDMRGGWFDAGDTNKYVTFAAHGVHNLLDAYIQRPQIWTDDFNIPESGNGIPDLIDEIKFELDWIQRMQDEDGGVFIKLGVLDFKFPKRPGLDRRPRFYAPKCSSSTIATASMFSHAAWVFKDIPALANESKILESNALAAWDWFNSHPMQTDCDSQEVKSGDADVSIQGQIGLAVSSAVYLFALTGDTNFETYIAEHMQETRPFTQFGWAMYEPYVGSALLDYSQFKDANQQVADQVIQKFTHSVSPLLQNQANLATLDPYRAYMPDPQYHWGSNAVKSTIANSIHSIETYRLGHLLPESNRFLSLDFIHYLHGVNPLGIVYLTNMYEYGVSHSANEMYHEWFGKGIYSNALTSPNGPPPGYITGGPNASYTGSANLAELPPMRAYLDSNQGGDLKMWEITEPSIVYQSAYIKILSKFVGA